MFSIHAVHPNTLKHNKQHGNVFAPNDTLSYRSGMHIGQVITYLLEQKADKGEVISDNLLAERSGVPQPTISRIRTGESKDPRRNNIEKIAKALGTTADEMYRLAEKGVERYRISEKPHAHHRVAEPSAHYHIRAPKPTHATAAGQIFDANVRPTSNIGKPVPLISWVTAGEWAEIVDNFQPGDAEQWFHCPVPHSEKTFALTVVGDSMCNPGGRHSFAHGDVIYVDPERPAQNGSYVVVRLEDSREATFKKLLIDGSKKWLKPLNPDWPNQLIEINGNATICGVAIGKLELF